MVDESVLAALAGLSVTASFPFLLYGAWIMIDAETVSWNVLTHHLRYIGVGLTLTAASSVAFLELPWTPGELQQAEDRCHRIGQEESVNVYYLIADGTIEEQLARLIDKKRKVLDSVLDGKESDESSMLSELIEEYKS